MKRICYETKESITIRWLVITLFTQLPFFCSTVFAQSQQGTAETTCNGLPNLCSVKVTDTHFAMVHNAMSAVENGFVFAANHMQDPLVEALDAGYRALNVDICNCNGNLQFCHGGDEIGCGIGRVDPLQAFTDINTWIDRNPNNVVLLSLQVNEDADETIPLSMIQTLLEQVPGGFAERLYDHWPVNSEWPSLGELIANEKQIVFFYFQGPNGNGAHINGLNYWYDFVKATDWRWESVQELESTLLQDCPITRGRSSTGDFFVIEAFVTESSFFGLQFQPSRAAAREINTVQWAGPVMDACSDIHGFPATILAVDFWSEGNLPTLMQQRNALLIGSPIVAPLNTPAPTIETSEIPTLLPTLRPSIKPSLAPTETRIQTTTPTISTGTTESPSEGMTSGSPTQSSSLTTTFIPSMRPTTVPENSTESDCHFFDEIGELVRITNGQSFENSVLSLYCDEIKNFTCFCHMGEMECPYCVFQSQEGDISCDAQSNGNETSISSYGNESICICETSLFYHNAGIVPCKEHEINNSSDTAQSNGDKGDTLVNGVEEEFPSSATGRNGVLSLAGINKSITSAMLVIVIAFLR